MIAYDFEVFVYDWLVVFKDIATNETNIIINDDKKLKEFYDKHQNNVFVGYNNKSYDDILIILLPIKCFLKSIQKLGATNGFSFS